VKGVWTRFQKILPVLAIAFVSSATSFAGIEATATFTDTQLNASTYQYSMTLDNTGTTTIGTFWFSWIPGAGFLSATPSSINSPAGWSDIVTNANSAIQWTTGTLLQPGDSVAGFMFDSTETPAQLLGTVPSGLGAGDPITTAFVYIDAPLADPGFQLKVTPAAPGAPEPGTIILAASALCGIAGFLALRSRWLRSQ